MQPRLHILLIGALAVAMATGAPVSSQEKLVGAEQTGEAVDRAKRAQEEIVFGNQQNKARVVAKKSDLSNILPAAEPPGERDQGSEVIVHKVMPVSEELAARAEAAVDSPSENNEKMKEAVEDAMRSLTESDNGAVETNGEDVADKTELKEQAAEQLAADEIEDGEQGTGEASEAAEEKLEDNDNDEDLRGLQKAAIGSAVPDGGRADDDNAAQEDSEEEVVRLLHDTAKEGQESDTDLDRDRERSYENRMKNYLMSLKDWRGLPYYQYPYFSRYRRSLASSKKIHTPRSKPARRIKRDLLDDSYNDQYDKSGVPYTAADINDALLSSPQDYTPLTDEEAEYLYNHLVNYLANNYTPEQLKLDEEEEETPLDSYLDGYEDGEGESYAPYEIYNEESVPVVSSPYEGSYSYEPVELDNYQNYAKRGMIEYYPEEDEEEEEEEKRYFFPFSKEPETHWGAFVPEKRDYNEAIQRLQRLAMALSDNPGPYYREILEDYRRK